jgi:hypothetical protein
MMNVRPKGRYDKGSGRRRFVTRVDSRRIRQASFFIIVCGLFSISPAARSQNGGTVEYPVKLGFLYNFTKFVEWPPNSFPDSGAPLAICIVGFDPFSPGLEGELRTRTVGSHSVEVKTLKASDTLRVCQVVFVPFTEQYQAATIVSRLKGSSTLTVGETEGFAELGGVINLTVEENKVRFEINPLAAERAHLKISSKLLSLAKIVKERTFVGGS